MRYCQWFKKKICNNHICISNLTLFNNETWCHLSRYLNSQNCPPGPAENPHIYVETSLHPIKVRIICGMGVSRRQIIGSILFLI